MANEKIEKKIKLLKERIKNFISKSDGDIEDIHKIRTSSREVLSLLNEEKLHCEDLKRVLKLSNKIRDIDVLLTQYLIEIPDDYQKQIDILQIRDILKDERQKEVVVFLEYLRGFSTQNISLLESNPNTKINIKPDFSSKIKQLHKFRIFIKNQLNIAKNNEPIEKEKVELLTKIKDILGNINDNHNAIKLIKKATQKKEEIKSLKKYTKAQNLQKFKEVEQLIFRLEKEFMI